MAYLKITHEYITNNYPEAYEQILKNKFKSRSKYKNVAPEDCEWFIWWGVQINSYSFKDILNGNHLNKQKEENKIISDFRAKYSRSAYWHSDTLNKTPSILQQHIDKMNKEYKEQQETERKRVASLTPEEKGKETEELLKNLRKSKGFMEIKY